MSNARLFQRDADGYLPLEGYGAIGNGRTVALVGHDGSIDWCCFSRIDRASIFARILDAKRGGHWQIAPAESWTATRHYLDDTNILITEFTTDTGVAQVVDMMPSIAFGSDLGVSQALWDGMLLRFVRGIRGAVTMRMEIQPRFNYAREDPSYELIPGRGALICADSGALRFVWPDVLSIEGDSLVSAFTVAEGEGRYASATYHGSGAVVWTDLEPDMATELYDREIEGWQRWIGRCAYDGPYAEHVRRSALILKLLDYLPSGAMAAAATTSLPEGIGGVRNWDYRYAWIRDTAYALHALHSIGYRDEAEGFLQWVIDVTNDDPTALQIMYRVDGGQDLEERELEHLDGYKGSRPVRVGNGAHDQRQLDRFGEVLDAAYVHRRFGGVVNNDLWGYLVEIIDEVGRRWRLPDSGIWEVRSEPRRMTFSNVMCWVAFDRAIALAEMDCREAPLDQWRATRDTIRAEVMDQGVSQHGYFSQSFRDNVLDASALSFPLRDFVPADHPIMRATIEAVERHLTTDGLVARYVVRHEPHNVDGLPGDEGRFVLCSCWLIDCLTGLGELDRAQKSLEKLLARSNDLGLFAEQIDPASGAFLGNFPQAFSHLGIVNSIVNLARARGDIPGEEDMDKVTGAISSRETPMSRREAPIVSPTTDWSPDRSSQ